MSAPGPCFDTPVAPNGYAWWYVDALSDDGQDGLTIIAFVGSVFSPYYAAARRRGRCDPENHCAVNVALYGRTARRWAMTERGRGALRRTATMLAIGPSGLAFDDTGLTIRLDEICMPRLAPLRGTVRVRPAAMTGRSFDLDAAGRHRWAPLAPSARVEVRFTQPNVRWSGSGYLDRNDGDEPLEAAFRRWDWARAATRDGATILYDVTARDGTERTLALRAGRDGAIANAPLLPHVTLPRSRWGVARATRADPTARVTIVQTLEDAPFYARALLDTQLHGERVRAVHESLSLARFDRRWVQSLLPFRMPRRGSYRGEPSSA